jgi:hypothetical protein
MRVYFKDEIQDEGWFERDRKRGQLCFDEVEHQKEWKYPDNFIKLEIEKEDESRPRITADDVNYVR